MTPDISAAFHEALADDLLLERQLTGFALHRTIERAENPR
jgi:hypothetical protein